MTDATTNPTETSASPDTAAAPSAGTAQAPVEGEQDTAPEGAGQEGDATAAPAEGSEVNSAGEQPAEHQEFAIEPPEEFAAFGDEFKAFSSEMDGWLKDNPNATARDALQEAAIRQARSVTQAAEAHQQQTEQWGEQAKKDPEIGGAQFDQNVAQAVKAIDAYGSPEFKALLNESGLGSHPEVIRFAMKAGAALAEPGVVTGATSNKPRSSFADSIYPKK